MSWYRGPDSRRRWRAFWPFLAGWATAQAICGQVALRRRQAERERVLAFARAASAATGGSAHHGRA